MIGQAISTNSCFELTSIVSGWSVDEAEREMFSDEDSCEHVKASRSIRNLTNLHITQPDEHKAIAHVHTELIARTSTGGMTIQPSPQPSGHTGRRCRWFAPRDPYIHEIQSLPNCIDTRRPLWNRSLRPVTKREPFPMCQFIEGHLTILSDTAEEST